MERLQPFFLKLQQIDNCSGASPGRRFEAGVHLTETGQRFDELTANFNQRRSGKPSRRVSVGGGFHLS